MNYAYVTTKVTSTVRTEVQSADSLTDCLELYTEKEIVKIVNAYIVQKAQDMAREKCKAI